MLEYLTREVLVVMALLCFQGILCQVEPMCIKDDNCRLPKCQCCGTASPGNVSIEQVPQMVIITFDGSMSSQVKKITDYILEDVYNPNNCQGKMTFILDHEYTDYSMTEMLFSQGHEMAVNTVTNSDSSLEYWRNADISIWTKEIVGMKTMLNRFANIPDENIEGFRAPLLEVNEDMYRTLYENAFTYDISRPTCRYANKPHILYPYTYDYPSCQDCPIGQCPSKSYPGLWQVPIIDLTHPTSLKCDCAVMQGCGALWLNGTQEEWVEYLKWNFLKSYKGNRAPFGLHLSLGWFTLGTGRQKAIKEFLEWLVAEEDIWFLTVSQLIAYMETPCIQDDTKGYQPWKCFPRPPARCTTPTKCQYKNKPTMYTCSQCPKCYPSVDDPTGSCTCGQSGTYHLDGSEKWRQDGGLGACVLKTSDEENNPK